MRYNVVVEVEVEAPNRDLAIQEVQKALLTSEETVLLDWSFNRREG